MEKKVKKTRRSVNNNFFVILFSIISLALIQTSCGGGGGGGGGGAAGPDSAPASSTPTSTPSTQSAAPSVDLSNAKEIISFKFEQSENPSALSEISPDDLTGNPNSSSAEVVVPYPNGTLSSTPLLKATIQVSPNAHILENTNQTYNFFDNATPVQFTVEAEDGTQKVWTVALDEMASTEHQITYLPEGIVHTNPSTYTEGQPFALDTTTGATKYDNYSFVAWYDNEEFNGSPVSVVDGNTDITLYAKLNPAPWVDTTHCKIYANGIPLSIQSYSGGTMIYYNDNGTQTTVNTINNTYPANYSGYTVYAGMYNGTTSSYASNITYPVTEGEITITGGNIEDVWGGNSGSNSPLPQGSRIILSGNPVVGDTSTQTGIRLKTFTNNWAEVNNSVTSPASITLIAPQAMHDSDIVAKAQNGATVAHEKFNLLNSTCQNVLGLKAKNGDVVVKGSVTLPITPIWANSYEYFTVGEGNVNDNGSIFSVYVENGYFTVPETALQNTEYDMAIPASDGDNEYIESGLTTTTHLRYIQFKFQGEDLSSEAASAYLAQIHFYVDNGKRIKVKINLQTVPWDVIGNLTYFNGSFYEVVETKNANGEDINIRWDDAYNQAKQKTFNGLKGYLMTITSKVENMFIFDRVYTRNNIPASRARGWIGATRSACGTPDANSWTHNSENYHNYWIWACGPEANTQFWNKAKGNGGSVSGKFAAWDNLDCRWNNKTWSNNVSTKPTNPKTNHGPGPMYSNDAKYWPAGGTDADNRWYVDWKEPNNLNNIEAFAQYLGVYSWNDQAVNPNSDKAPISYIVEYTKYGNQEQDHEELGAEQRYSKPVVQQ